MVSFKKKVLNKLSKEVDQFTYNTASVMTNVALKKDIFNKSRLYRKQIESKFDYFLEKYSKIVNYLYYDFAIKSIDVDGETSFINEDLEIKDKVDNILKSKLDIKIKLMDRFKYNKLIKKWWILSNILKYYKPYTMKLQEVSNQKNYKGINFENELKEHKANEYLIENFEFMQNG